MKRIDLENGYVLDFDKLCITLKKDIKVETNNKGKEIEKSNALGYYPNISSAVQGMYEDMILSRLKPKNKIKEAVDIFIEVSKDIEKITRKFKL